MVAKMLRIERAENGGTGWGSAPHQPGVSQPVKDIRLHRCRTGQKSLDGGSQPMIAAQERASTLQGTGKKVGVPTVVLRKGTLERATAAGKFQQAVSAEKGMSVEERMEMVQFLVRGQG